MRNIGEKDVDSEVGRDFTNFRIRRKVVSSCAGANADESSVNLAFATADPLSELVWSPRSGLGLKSANRGADARKPLHQWQRIRVGDDIHKSSSHLFSESSTKIEEGNCMVDMDVDSCHHQTDESRKEIAAAENECSLVGAENGLPDKGKGKALSDGDIYGRSSDDEEESSNSAGHSPKGVKRKVWDEGAILGSKRMKKQILMKPDSSFLKWISNMTTTKEDSLSPLPLACSKNCQVPSTSMGFRGMFQSLYCRETDESKKIVESVEQLSREVTVDPAAENGGGEETKTPGRSRTSLWITRLCTDTLRSEKGKEIGEEGIDLERNSWGKRSRCLFCGGCCECARGTKLRVRAEMFHAIRNLRLTRADILRLMHSDIPLSHLKGYYLRLRLRLGNEEAGGYYVGCITASQNKGEYCRMMIWVDVGGIKSSVSTQYVSNHDFQDDEIKAWWSRIIHSGCRIPSLAELSSKFNHRQTLGF